MIQANELGKGNLLCWSLKSVHPVTTLPDEIIEVFAILEDRIAYVYPNIENRVEPFEDDVAQMGRGTIPLAELEPIPLTNEWLQKAGIVVNGEMASLNDGHHLPFQWDGKQLTLHSLPVTHLHQLQNLYTDATGVMLEIQP